MTFHHISQYDAHIPPVSTYTVFRKMSDYTRCAGSFLDVGAPVVAPPNRNGTYVASIGEIVDRSGRLRGWIYLGNENGAHSIIVSLLRGATPAELRAANLKMPAGDLISSFGTLGTKWPWASLHAVPCRDIQLPKS